MLRVRSFLIIGALLVYSAAMAIQNPLSMLQATSGQLLLALDKNQSKLRNNPNLVESLVKQYVIPHADVVTMSRSAVGKQYWNSSSKAMQQQFMHGFQKLVIKTYSAAFMSYNADMIKFAPMRGSVSANSRPYLHSQVIRKSGERINIAYRLRYTGSRWLVYDFSVEGVSMIRSFRSQFAPILKKSGMAGLIKKINH